MRVNKIDGQIIWGIAPGEPVLSGGSFDDRLVQLRSQRINDAVAETDLVYDQQNDIACSILGYILNREDLRTTHQLEATEDQEIIIELYKKFGVDFQYHLDGIFLITLYDRKSKRLYLLTDSFGFILPVYYSQKPDSLVFSTSLKQLLTKTGIHPVMNQDALRDLLYSQKCIPNELTLVDEVHKIPAGFRMEVDMATKAVHLRKTNWKIKKRKREDAKRGLLAQVKANVSGLLPYSGSRRAVTLSSGFDTNLVLYLLSEFSGVPLSSYTIGGKEFDEIPAVKKIVAHYPSVDARYRHVPETRLNSLPDIVWDLEGYLYEGGIYLMDELGALLESTNKMTAFTGEGGDGLFNSYKNMRIQKIRMSLIGTIHGYIYYRFIRPLFHLQSPEIQVLKKFRRVKAPSLFSKGRDLNLKKMGILLNAHGIMPLNPFLSLEYRSYCKALGKRLSRKKRFYKKEVRKVVPPEVSEILAKLDGATDTWYLLEPYLHLLEPLLNSELCKRLLSERDRNKIQRNPDKFEALIHQLFFIYTFQELFLSGKYDFRMDRPGVTLEELF
ncbi:asparagine synthase-related protein [Bacteroidota bacterium]